MNIELSRTNTFENFTHVIIPVNNLTDYSGHYKIENLKSNTEYFYRIWFSDLIDSNKISDKVVGRFNTSPVIDPAVSSSQYEAI